jgi:uncharacterized protein YeaO (DUF488 family)/pterin-4a-carbinolamine dehydratase
VIKIKRIYEQPANEDGFRILVDRLWPRGISKDNAKIDLWLKEIGPSDKVRNWFSHDPKKWQGFKTRYEAELRTKKELVDKIKQEEKEHGTVTLLYSAKDEEHNQAVVLDIFLKGINPPVDNCPTAPTPSSVAQEKCKPPKKALSMLREEAEKHLKQVEDWNLVNNAIEKNYKLKDFRQAIEFINKVADIAEAENHHPDILLWNWNNVKLTLSTHAVKGLSKNDFVLASRIDKIELK